MDQGHRMHPGKDGDIDFPYNSTVGRRGLAEEGRPEAQEQSKGQHYELDKQFKDRQRRQLQARNRQDGQRAWLFR